MTEEKETIFSIVKNYFFLYGKKLLTLKITQLLLSWGLKVTGPIGWIVSFFVNGVLKFVWPYIAKIWIRTETKIEAVKDLKDYDEKINAPGASAEDIRKAGKDFIVP